MNQKALLELAKSFGRFIYFGVLGLVVVFLTSLVSGGSLNNVVVTIGGQHLNAGFVIVSVVAAVAKAIDRYVHANDNVKANGIAPF
jgi:hypothetical protein